MVQHRNALAFASLCANQQGGARIGIYHAHDTAGRSRQQDQAIVGDGRLDRTQHWFVCRSGNVPRVGNARRGQRGADIELHTDQGRSWQRLHGSGAEHRVIMQRRRVDGAGSIEHDHRRKAAPEHCDANLRICWHDQFGVAAECGLRCGAGGRAGRGRLRCRSERRFLRDGLWRRGGRCCGGFRLLVGR